MRVPRPISSGSSLVCRRANPPPLAKKPRYGSTKTPCARRASPNPREKVFVFRRPIEPASPATRRGINLARHRAVVMRRGQSKAAISLDDVLPHRASQKTRYTGGSAGLRLAFSSQARTKTWNGRQHPESRGLGCREKNNGSSSLRKGLVRSFTLSSAHTPSVDSPYLAAMPIRPRILPIEIPLVVLIHRVESGKLPYAPNLTVPRPRAKSGARRSRGR